MIILNLILNRRFRDAEWIFFWLTLLKGVGHYKHRNKNRCYIIEGVVLAS